MRAAALAVGWATALGATAAAAGTAAAAPGAAAPPNFVIVLTDDQDVLLSSLSYMPKLKKLVADEGMTFAWAFDAVPVCCPSRSSLWTGRLQHNTKVTNNSIEGNCASLEWQAGPEKQNLAALLKAAGGYKTFYGGKFLNNCEARGAQRPSRPRVGVGLLPTRCPHHVTPPPPAHLAHGPFPPIIMRRRLPRRGRREAHPAGHGRLAGPGRQLVSGEPACLPAAHAARVAAAPPALHCEQHTAKAD